MFQTRGSLIYFPTAESTNIPNIVVSYENKTTKQTYSGPLIHGFASHISAAYSQSQVTNIRMFV